MLKLKKIAITGCISSGKSTVCGILKKHGAYYVSSDEIIHTILLSDPTCIKQISCLLGPAILSKGKIDRKKVAEQVFKDASKLKALEDILHPRLNAIIKTEYRKAQKQNKAVAFIVESPLLIETKMNKEFDLTVLVTCKESLAKKRFKKKGFTGSDFDRRMERHFSEETKLEQADFIIANNETLNELEEKAKKLLMFITKKNHHLENDFS